MAETSPQTNDLPLIGVFDSNLGFPTTRADWAAFFAAQTCSISETRNLDALMGDLHAHRPAFAYLPAAGCFFLRDDPAYRGFASARSARTGMPSESSVLIVRRDHPTTRWQDLRGARLGYINTCCTTSYFAPMILLAHAGETLAAFFQPVAVAAWQGQIDAVVANALDASMVYEDVWLARPDNAAQTKILARLDALPTPAFVVRADANAAFTARLQAALFAFKPTPGETPLYTGFADYQHDLMERFLSDLTEAGGARRLP